MHEDFITSDLQREKHCSWNQTGISFKCAAVVAVVVVVILGEPPEINW